jgi:hypothetical protein
MRSYRGKRWLQWRCHLLQQSPCRLRVTRHGVSLLLVLGSGCEPTSRTQCLQTASSSSGQRCVWQTYLRVVNRFAHWWGLCVGNR